MVPGFGVWAECQSIGTSGKNERACYLAQKTLSWCIFLAFVPRVWFPYSSFQQVRQPSIPSPVEEDTSKIRDTSGTIFIQGPSIVLPVWRFIMFSDSYLRACMKLRIVQKHRFSLHESRWTKAWCPGLVSGPSAYAQELVARIRGLVIQPPKLSVGAYFELSFLGCGFLIHLSNRSDSPRFRASWKKIRQKYGTRRPVWRNHSRFIQLKCTRSHPRRSYT